MFNSDVGLTDTVIHALDECQERRLEDLNAGGSKWKNGVKAFFHGAAIGFMDSMMVFGTVVLIAGIFSGRKGKTTQGTIGE